MKTLGLSASLTIRAKFRILVCLSVITVVAVAGVALWVSHEGKRSVERIHTETIASLERLQRVEQFLREVELRIPGVIVEMFSGPGSKAYIESSLPEAKRAWADFKARPQEGPAAALTQEFDKAFESFQAMIPRLGSALAQDDKKALGNIANEWLDLKRQLLKPLSTLVATARSDVAQAVKQAEDQQRKTSWAIAVGLALFLVTSLPFSMTLVRGINTALGRMVEVLGGVADGDFTRQLEVKSNDEIGQMAAALNQALARIRDALYEVKAAAETTTLFSQQLTSASGEISTGAQEQAASLEETAASLEEITGTVKQNADNARQANQLALGSRETAEKSGHVVTDAVSAMEEINESSKKIADIITTIDEIAFQTNLLALNAAVEAARAGEQGRGFAVVAAEVRSLAQRSAAAAKEIKTLIQDSVQKVQDGSKLVNKSGQTLEEIMSSVKKVTHIIGEIAAASQEQSGGIDQVNKAVSQMNQVMQSNMAQTEELSSMAESLSEQAEQLQGLVRRFKLGEHAESAAPAEPVDVAAANSMPGNLRPRGKQPLVSLAVHHQSAPALPIVKGSAKQGEGFEVF